MIGTYYSQIGSVADKKAGMIGAVEIERHPVGAIVSDKAVKGLAFRKTAMSSGVPVPGKQQRGAVDVVSGGY